MTTVLSFSYFSCYQLCLLVLVFVNLCLSNPYSDNILCIDSEREALLLFKHSLIDETNRLASWVAEDRDCCRWTGIACDNSTGHVHRIHLRGLDGRCLDFLNYYYTNAKYQESSKQMLRGHVGPSLLDLKQLDHLDLSCNDFGWIQVPEFIGSLKNLRYLNLSNSNFSGIIHSQFRNLSNLQVLGLGNFNRDNPSVEYTSIMDMQWFSSLGKLHHLDMSGVDLSKVTNWVQVINTLSSLLRLHLSNCKLSYIQPDVPSLNLTSLSVLNLSFNNFDSSVPRWILSITSDLVSLDLSKCNFHGPIPSSFGSFRNLTSLELLHVSENDFMNSPLILEELPTGNLISLDISFCGISSSRLESIHNLTTLHNLQLSGNQLTDRIPESLGNLCNLRKIDLSSNNYGNISLTYILKKVFECKSSALNSLSIVESGLSGSIPYSIEQLSSLEELDLRFNYLNGSIPYEIGRLSSLKRFLFSNNLLTGVVTEAHFAKLVNLKILIGIGNNLTLRLQDVNWIPPFQLKLLYLDFWVLGPQFPLWLKSQKDLTDLSISNTRISSPMPESFLRSFPNLYILAMSQNHIQGTLTLSGIPSTLEVVDISSNEFSGSLHHLLCSDGVKEVLYLNLGNNHLSDSIPECWEKWPNLVFLNLENNNFSGEIPKTLGSLSYLTLLNMHGNKISGSLPASLMNLERLEILQLGENELVGSIPTWIGTKLTILSIINLRSNNFKGNIPHELCYLIHVQILDLAYNNLFGNIPRCFANFSVLSGIRPNSTLQYTIPLGITTMFPMVVDSLVMKGREETYSTILGLVKLLDLSSNNLFGDIPTELTALRELKSLNLSRNQLTGRIPEKIGEMKALESFDLSINNLCGELPLSLSRLNFLSSFNVSHNKLTGRIPTSTQIQSLNESSFFGNKLCGAPLSETKGCVPIEAPVNITQNIKENHKRDFGLIISIVAGFITGFWMIVGTLVVKRTWRIAYFHFLCKLIKVYD